MKVIAFATSVWFTAILLSLPVLTSDNDLLFVNLTTNEVDRSNIKKGAIVIACPACIKQHVVRKKYLLGGIKVGGPILIGEMLFQYDTQTLS